MGLLDLASTIAVNAVFSLCAVALDTSYIIPIACKLLFRDHPEVNFVVSKSCSFYFDRLH